MSQDLTTDARVPHARTVLWELFERPGGADHLGEEVSVAVHRRQSGSPAGDDVLGPRSGARAGGVLGKHPCDTPQMLYSQISSTPDVVSGPLKVLRAQRPGTREGTRCESGAAPRR